jgi:beta-glucosidase
VEVENTGTRPGEEVVQLYMKAVDRSGPVPLHSLGGFERVVLRARERKTVQFVLSPRQFSAIQADGRRMVEPGAFEISVGGKQPGPLDAAASMVRGSVRIGGPAKELN